MTYATLLQVNTRVRLRALSDELGRPVGLGEVPDEELDRWAELAADYVWLLGVWTTSEAGRRVSRENPDWRREFEALLPDLTEEDICGSCFSLTAYDVPPQLGGDEGLARLRARLEERGLRLILDFVPNHTAPDHPWVRDHPQRYVAGTAADLEAQPQNWTRIDGAVLAHGRDPYFPGWPDTLQLDYSRPEVVEAMGEELLRVAERCDGVRCDMAMLILPEVFERTWGRPARSFWPEITAGVRRQHPGFEFLAEVYWDLEYRLQQEGFDHCYDKRLYDRLCSGDAPGVHGHLTGELAYQAGLARFLENHDEPRVRSVLEPEHEKAAAVVTYLSPGLRFVFQGQETGARVRVPVHLCRGPEEVIDADLTAFYRHLLPLLHEPVFRDGDWRLLDCLPAWEANPTADRFVAMAWELGEERRLAVANLAPHASQCYVRLPDGWRPERGLRLADRLSPACYDRTGERLYLDLPAWGRHAFTVTAGGEEEGDLLCR